MTRAAVIATVAHRLFARDLSLCWHDTALVSNAVQKVKAEIVRLFDTLRQQPEWAAGRTLTTPRDTP